MSESRLYQTMTLHRTQLMGPGSLATPRWRWRLLFRVLCANKTSTSKASCFQMRLKTSNYWCAWNSYVMTQSYGLPLRSIVKCEINDILTCSEWNSLSGHRQLSCRSPTIILCYWWSIWVVSWEFLKTTRLLYPLSNVITSDLKLTWQHLLSEFHLNAKYQAAYGHALVSF